jgi:type IV secretory pathway VirB10-like protein
VFSGSSDTKENQNSFNSREISGEYQKQNSKNSIDNIMSKIKQVSVAPYNNLESSVIAVKHSESGVNDDTVPPLVDQDEERFKHNQKSNMYASVSGKSLMFNFKPNASGAQASNDNTEQGVRQKLSSDSSTDNVSNNLAEDVEPQHNLHELKAGSVIPATMVNGLNSDLPGVVIAIVRQNIYSSITRQFLLIPQGSRLVGSYDSHVIYAQERVAVAWNKLIYPDGSSTNLKAMPGTDIEGYSGFYDQVDNKYWRLFGASFVMGVITGAMQYSQSSNTSNIQSMSTPTVGQTMSSSLGQQMGQTGLMITQKNLNVQPTLLIRPNYPFNIIVTSDLALKPFKVIE